MSVTRARSILAERGRQAQTILLAVLLELDPVPSWAHGEDHEGRAVVLVGRHRLEQRETTGAEFGRVALEAIQEGEAPLGIQFVTYRPQASAFIAEIVAGEAKEILGVGPRESGKSQGVPAALAILAEQHDAGGFPLPLRALLLNESLISFSMKFARSLEEELWGHVWDLRNDRREAVLMLGGQEYVIGDAVGACEDAAAERLKTRCHVLGAEELTPSLNDTKGIEEDKYTLALSSISLPTPRPVAMATCNPSDPHGWVYRRFIAPGQPGCVAVTVPARDRLSDERIAELRRTFHGDAAQCARLIDGEWVALPRGQVVAEGFDPRIHVATQPLRPSPGYLLGLGFDAGHSPACVIGQSCGGAVQVYASFNEQGVGIRELLERQVLPWVREFAPWALAQYGAGLVHIIDPNMTTPDQSTITRAPVQEILDLLGGRHVRSVTRWAPRREAVRRVLAPRHAGGRPPLLINPGPETAQLVEALSTGWVYGPRPDGQVQDTPKKPNPPWADLGDAFAYLADWLLGSELMELSPTPREIKVETAFSLDPAGAGAQRPGLW